MASSRPSFVCATPRQHGLYFLAVFRSQRPARPARSFKKRAHRRLKAWMNGCGQNLLHTARPGSCRHDADWAAAGTLSGSPANITGPGAHDAFSQIVSDEFWIFERWITPDKLFFCQNPRTFLEKDQPADQAADQPRAKLIKCNLVQRTTLRTTLRTTWSAPLRQTGRSPKRTAQT